MLPHQGCGAGSSSERTRTAITAALKKKLRDIMGEFGQLRDRLQQEYRRALNHLPWLHACPVARQMP